jgi:heterokaryon incompatibility protein (HET)
MPDSTFQYDTLDLSGNQIRLLRPKRQQSPVQPADSTNAPNSIVVTPDLSLDFDIETTSLDDAPEYIALSYVWGEKDLTEPIQVNDEKILVTKNLFTVLQNLQYDDVVPALWVDSLCINQQHAEEKSHQVARMKAIFSKASKVIIWLGLKNDRSDNIATIISNIPRLVRDFFLATDMAEDDDQLFDIFEASRRVEFLEYVAASGILKYTNGESMTPFQFLVEFMEAFGSIPWFYRVWIIQEFVLSTKCQFQIGQRKMSVLAFTLVAFLAVFHLENPTDGFSPSWLRESVRLDLLPSLEWQWILLSFRWLHKDREWPLSELLVHSYCSGPARPESLHLHASERRDYIYGLTGLVPKSLEKTGLMIDYTMSWQEVFIDTAYRILRGGDFTLFSLCQGQHKLSTSEIPSWVPIFHKRIMQPNMRAKFIQNDRILGNTLYSASGSTSIKCELVSNPQKNPILKIQGVIVDIISRVQPEHLRHNVEPFRGPHIQQHRHTLYGSFFLEMTDLFKESLKLKPRVYSRSVIKDALWRLPTWDCEYAGNSSPYAMQRTDEDNRHRSKRLVNLSRSVQAYMTAKDLVAESSSPKSTFQTQFNRLKSQKQRLTACYQFWKLQHKSRREVLNSLSETYRYWLRENPDPLDEMTKTANSEMFLHMLMFEAGTACRLLLTEKRGYVGIGPGGAELGDIVCIFYGAKVPYILRKRPEGGYVYIGEAYIHEGMDGQLMTTDRQAVEFELF